ncbi:MAG TPA: trehalose-phosphatase [Terracidiphilus sp.]|jgi:trehalose-phosphatase
MTPEAAEKLEDFFRRFAGGANPLLLLDYDGTLAPFRVDRFKARPWAGVPELLARIQQQGKTRMAVITGRPAREIAPLLGLHPIDQVGAPWASMGAPALEVWGLHGAERLYPDGRRELEQAPAEAQEKLEELREHLRRDSLGGLFEDKPNAAVVHWRGASPRKARLIEQRTRALFEPLTRMEGLALLEFEAGLELRTGRNKGGVVEAILAEVGDRGPVAYLGDDLTDEAAFWAVKGRGLSVLVRREWRETAAEIWLRPPGELRAFLDWWIKAGTHHSPALPTPGG